MVPSNKLAIGHPNRPAPAGYEELAEQHGDWSQSEKTKYFERIP